MVWYRELARRILPRPTPTPAGDKPPRYIFSLRHRPSVYGSARCERQGMKSRSCGLVQRIGAADSATPHPDPSGGQAPALHFLIPPSTIGLRFGTFRRWRAGIEVDWRAHPGSESGMCFRSNRSCRLAPAHQGMKMGVWLLELFAGHLPPSATPLDSRLRGNDDSGPRIPGKGAAARRDVRLLERAGHKATLEAAVFHFRSNRSCLLSPAHEGMKSRSCGLVQRIGAADSATPHPDPSGGQAPRLAKSSTALHLLIPPSTIGLQIGTFRRWRAGIEVDWRAHPGSESGTCFRTNDELRRRKDEMGGRRSAVWRQAESPEGDGYEGEGEDDQCGHFQ